MPCGPVAPVLPCGPVAPVLPRGPVGPVGPSLPGVPCGPVGPRPPPPVTYSLTVLLVKYPTSLINADTTVGTTGVPDWNTIVADVGITRLPVGSTCTTLPLLAILLVPWAEFGACPNHLAPSNI